MVFYILIFLSVYVQVFFLVTFFENRKKIFKVKDSNFGLASYPSVSVIVPCFNEEKSVAKTINSLLNLDYPKDKLKIIVVDDGSQDKTWEVVQQFNGISNIKLIKKVNGGKFAALNLGLEYVDTEFVASVDADTILDINAMKEMVYYFSDKKTMAVGGTVLIANPSSFAQKAQSVEYQMYAYTKKMLGLVGGVMVAPGAFSVFRTQAVKKVGGYRKGDNLEDLELTFRMQTQRMKVDHCHTAFAFTTGPNTVRSLFKQRVRWSHGFFGNLIKYRDVIFDKDLGSFSFFTIPMGVVTYFTILFLFFISCVSIIQLVWLKLTNIHLVGFNFYDLHNQFKIDTFFIDTRVISFIVPILYFLVFLSILIGSRIAKRKILITSLFSFIFVYATLPPFWVLKSIYHIISSKMPSWR